MKKEINRSYKFRDPKARLNAALDTIEQFANQSSEGTHSHILPLPKDSIGLSKIITLAKYFIASRFSESFRKQLETAQKHQEKNLHTAIEELKRYHPLITNKTSSDAKILAERTLKTIQRFNKAVENESGEPPAWHKRLLKFLIKKTRKPLSTHKVELTSFLKKENQKVNTYIKQRPLAKPFTEREADAFRMKAISLVKNYEMLFPSLRETIQFLRETPILYSFSEEENKGNIPPSSIICLQQTLSPFPGEMIILKGSFMRDPGALNSSTPIPGSFEVSTESVQTGFPYPSQHYGWSLSDALIPSHLLHPERLVNVFPLLKKKEEVAQGLLNRTILLEKSRRIIEKKRELIKDHKKAFLSLHKTLCHAILNAAPKKVVPQDAKEKVEAFFLYVQNQDCPLKTLCSCYRKMNEMFLDGPRNALLNAWVSQTEQDLLIDHAKQRCEAAKAVLEKQMSMASVSQPDEGDSREVFDFVHCFGKVIGEGCVNLVLQSFSEMIDYAPPQLFDFEKKLHAAAFRQLRSFLKELKGEIPLITMETLTKALESDIELFNQKNVHDPLCSEVEHYYLSRFTK